MAASNSSRLRGARLPHEFPVIKIPEDAEVNEYHVSYSLKTAGGDVGVRLDRNCVRCFGTPDALVAAGIVLPDWIPVRRRSQCVALTESGLQVRIGGAGRPKGLYMHVSDFLCEAGKYQARWSLPRNSRLMAETDRLLLLEKREKEIQSARELVASWPSSASEFRERIGEGVDRMLTVVEACCAGGVGLPTVKYGGYRFDDAAIARVYELSDELREVMEAGGVVLDSKLREQSAPACIAEEMLGSDAAYADSPIQYGGNVVPFRKPCKLNGPRPL